MTEIIGILNVTPDSFSDGGKYNNADRALERVSSLLEEGASLVDIGAESTRPGAVEIETEEEWLRLEPVLAKLQLHYPPSIFSIDTRHHEVVRRSVAMWSPELTVNDMSGLNDRLMVDVVAAHALRVVLGHLPPTALGSTSRAHHQKKTDSQWEVLDQLITSYIKAVAMGIKPENIVLDPGIGFGKTSRLNNLLIGFAALTPSLPVMIGYSRKRFLGPNRFEATVNAEAGRRAVRSGAAFLRVHDVAVHRRMIREEKARNT